MNRREAINQIPSAPAVIEECGKWIYAAWTPGTLAIIDRLFLMGVGWRNGSPTSGDKTGPAVSALWDAAPLDTTVLRLAKEQACKPAENEVESYEQHLEWEGVTA